VQPPSDIELETRIIRNRLDSKEALKMRMLEAKAEMEQAPKLPWITKVFVNDKKDEFLKKTALWIVFQAYKLKQ